MNHFSSSSVSPSLRGALCILSLALAVLGCTQAPSVENAAAQEASAQALPRVATITPLKKTLQRRSDQPGQIEAFEQTPLYGKVAGYVRQVNVDIGDTVKQGDLLAVIASPELEAELEQKKAVIGQAEAGVAQARAGIVVAQAAITTAQAQVSEAEAAVARTQADYERWESEFKRMQDLAASSAVTNKLVDETRNQFQSADAARKETAAKITSAQANFGAAQAGLQQAHANHAAAEARLRVAQAEHRQTETMLAYTEIRAPYDGQVTERNIHTGHYVPPGATVGGRPLLVVMHSNVVRVFVDVPEMDAAFTDAGDPATVRVQALADTVFNGRVTRTAVGLDQNSRTLRTEIDLENSSGELRPGLYAYVSLLVEERPDVLALPTVAVLSADGKAFCYAVEGGKVVNKPLRLGLRAGSEVQIVEGLSGNEQVIAKNAAAFAAGQSVEILPPEKKP